MSTMYKLAVLFETEQVRLQKQIKKRTVITIVKYKHTHLYRMYELMIRTRDAKTHQNQQFLYKKYRSQTIYLMKNIGTWLPIFYPFSSKINIL